MSHWLDERPPRRDVVTIPILWLTIALSILIHLAALFLWTMRTPLPAIGDQKRDRDSDRLLVQLNAPPRPTPSLPASPRELQAVPRPPAKPPRAVVRLRPPPVVAAPSREAPVIPPPPPPPPAVAAPRTSPPIEGDLSAYIEARRRERGEQQAAPNDATAQSDRNLAANLPAPARGVAAQDERRGGGIFQIRRMSYDDAAFDFYGWNKDMGRKTPQLIEVRKGDNSDMRIAVVRRMIAIIRQFEKEDFVWESTRRSRNFVLSARLSDNAELESFLMHEFFDDTRSAQ